MGHEYNECQKKERRERARCARPSGGVDCIGMHLTGNEKMSETSQASSDRLDCIC